MKTALVLGAGGFIGSHMVKRLKSEGYWVRGVDLKYPEFSKSPADEFLIFDLRDSRHVEAVVRLDFYPNEDTHIPSGFSYLPIPFSVRKPFDEVYQFAADMGGAGYIFTGEHDADVMHNSASINLNVCHWAKEYGVKKLFYSSSACMYSQEWQKTKEIYSSWDESECIVKNFSLEESDAYPANPDSEYGWEKLFSERLFLAYARNYGLNVRIARFHNIFGPEGTYEGGKEKAPAALCRKVALSNGEVEIWGDGEQTRSFLYIDECIEGVRRLMESEFTGPVNIGSDEMISINDLALMIGQIAGKRITLKHIEGPQGVRGRNSDNTLIEKELGWRPSQSLKDGIERTYFWIKERCS